MRRCLGFLSLLATATSCAGPSISDATGAGLVSFDRTPPQGATVYERPTWQVGDQFTYRKGGKLAVALRVAEASDAGYVLVEDTTGLNLRLDRDLAEIERANPRDASGRRVKAPAIHQLSWPLWVGKRWRCDYVDKRPGQDEPIRSTFVCEAAETIRTSFGTEFECLRILETSRLEIKGRTFLDRTSVFYYAPKIGWFVRRLEDGVLTELESAHRQGQ